MQKKYLRKDSIELSCGSQAKPEERRKLTYLRGKAGSFLLEFSNKVKEKEIEGWKTVNVKVKVLSNGNYEFDVKGRITSDLIKRAAGEKKIISQEELKKIAEIQLPYLNTEDLEKAQKTIAGTAKSAGIKIEGQ
ncbi:hypothetical protein [endosymbiont GvMRE of Glomus versiforme]|uniref:hypothetical protein n=1 Tax=endosymbiont GvMRE of Glomus versiforme TaxID=2039283 RepID=UPI000ECDA235|nr:hypothetical protein [endosymbiont GvMRE of Glomus versiforme]RHZ37727.1 50S ribosomal protein L11 [endosymbiont GvMRE of Glomus versiforme]